MKELDVKELPIGINFTSNYKTNLYGFTIKKKDDSYKSFTSKDKTLKEKLKLSLQYHKYIQDDNIDKIIEIEKICNIDIKKISRNNKIGQDFKNILKKMNMIVEEIPLYIYYEKRSNRFYVKIPEQSCKYFTKNNPEKSLIESINYINNLQSQRESA
jgi:uncharacterized FlaG/YvyC family protein